MKILTFTLSLAVVTPAIVMAQTADPSTPSEPEGRAAEDITRDLNAGPPFAPVTVARPAPTPPATETRPHPASEAPAQAPSPRPPSPQPTSDVDVGAITRDLNAGPPVSASPRAVAEPAPSQRPIPAPVPDPVSAPAPAPAPAARPASPTSPPAPATVVETPPLADPAPTAAAPRPAASAAPAALDAAAMAALPFRLDLPAGVAVTEGRAGSDAMIYAVRRGATPLVMIYVGRDAQFPIYGGELVRRGGRETVVVTEETRRLALEHLFRSEGEGRDLHVWVSSPDGPDRDLGERIAQSVDPR